MFHFQRALRIIKWEQHSLPKVKQLYCLIPPIQVPFSEPLSPVNLPDVLVSQIRVATRWCPFAAAQCKGLLPNASIERILEPQKNRLKRTQAKNRAASRLVRARICFRPLLWSVILCNAKYLKRRSPGEAQSLTVYGQNLNMAQKITSIPDNLNLQQTWPTSWCFCCCCCPTIFKSRGYPTVRAFRFRRLCWPVVAAKCQMFRPPSSVRK